MEQPGPAGFTPANIPRVFRRFGASETGTITVEFVIWFPVIMMIGVVMFVLSFYIATGSEVQQVAHEMARSSFRLVNGAALEGDLCQEMETEVLPDVVARMALLDADRFVSQGPCPAQPDGNNYVTVSVTYSLNGTVLQSLAGMIGFQFDTISRTSTIQLG